MAALKKVGVFNPIKKQISDNITVFGNKKIQFRDTGIFIQSSADGKLLISSDGAGADDVIFTGNVTFNNDVTVSGAFSYGAVTATSLVVSGTTQLGDAAADTVTVFGNTTTNAAQNPTFIWLGTGVFTTSTGVNTLSGHTTVATAKNLIMGDATHLAGTLTIYQDNAGTKSLELVPATSFTINENTTLSTTKKVQFRDSGLYLYSSVDGQLDIIADTVCKVTAPTVELEATNITLDGDVTIDGAHALTTGTGLTHVLGALTVDGLFSFNDASVAGDFDIVGTDLQATTGTLNISKAGSTTTVKGILTVDQTFNVTGISTFTAGVVMNGTTQLGNAKADTVTFYGDIACNGAQNPDINFGGSSGTFSTTTGAVTLAGNTSMTGAATFATGTGAVSINGSAVIATTKDLTMGDATHIAGDFSAYRDGAGNPSFTFNPGTSIVLYENTSISGAYTFGTGTGAVSINGETTVATTKGLTLGTNAAIGGTFLIYRDGAAAKAFEVVPATSISINETTTVGTNTKMQFRDNALYVYSSADGQLDIAADVKLQIVAPTVDIESSTAIVFDGDTSVADAHTFGTGTGLTTIGGDLAIIGHIQAQEFTANAFQYPAPATEWVPAITGATLGANQAAKKCWIPLNFLKIGDEIVSYKVVGDVHEEGGDTVTFDCKLVRVNKADPLTTTDIPGGGIVQVTADGNFDVLADLTDDEVVATDKQYLLELLATTSNVSTNEAVKVIGVECKVNRKG